MLYPCNAHIVTITPHRSPLLLLLCHYIIIDVVVDAKGYIPRQVNHEDIEEDEDYPPNQIDDEEEEPQEAPEE